MRLQLLSDLHLESEAFEPEPAPGAEALVLAGDIDSTWRAFERFAGWPVPVWFVAGNHEFDGRELDKAWPALREALAHHGIRLIEREAFVATGDDGRRIRFVGTIRWSDFDGLGAARRERAMRAAAHFQAVMGATQGGRPFDAEAVRAEALRCRGWLEATLATAPQGAWDATCVITHFAPSLRSADARFGRQPGTASFCNDDDDLIPRADIWLHGHVHCRHDYLVGRAGRAPARVVCQARGLPRKGEAAGLDPLAIFTI
jgi:hypothetical protein